MRLIFIYGPPASGKLTVAEQLTKLTSISLFHNHLTRDLVKDIYGDDLGVNYPLVEKLRNDVFAYCAEKETDLIFTFVYGGVEDENEEAIIKSYIKTIKAHGGEVLFVELTANRDELLQRVGNESRMLHKKLLDPTVLSTFLESRTELTIPFVKSIKVDTSSMSPADSAKFIAQELELL
jgi:chloramphenicol 3-O-phosphotransferase